MKKIMMVIGMGMAISSYSQTVKVEERILDKNKVSLAGVQLSKYHQKQAISLGILVGSAGLMAIAQTQDEEMSPSIMKVALVLSGLGVVINVSSLSNLKKSAKHLQAYE